MAAVRNLYLTFDLLKVSNEPLEPPCDISHRNRGTGENISTVKEMFSEITLQFRLKNTDKTITYLSSLAT